MKRCLVYSGLPGSGKSRHIASLVSSLNSNEDYYDNDLGFFRTKSAVIVSADHYFLDSEGVYRFDPTLIGDAHKNCMKRFLLAVGSDEPLVIVDNTNTCAYEIAPYVAIAEAFDYDVAIVRVMAKTETCTLRNVHGVPGTTIGAMSEAMRRETLPPWWRVIKKNSD